MRYRSFARHGLSSSAITLCLQAGETAEQADRLVCTALECGINSFSVAAKDEAGAQALRRAVAALGRRPLIVMLRLDPDGPSFPHQARTMLAASGVSYLDVAMIERPATAVLSPERRSELEDLRTDRLTGHVGFAAEGAVAEALLEAFDFDAMAMRYSVASGWPERNLLKAAALRGVTVLGYGHHVEAESGPTPIMRGLSRLLRRAPAVSTHEDVYGFLNQTPGWTGEQVTLAYALTEPGLTSVLVDVDQPAKLEALAQAVERELPAGAAAQIEIARFSAVARRSAA